MIKGKMLQVHMQNQVRAKLETQQKTQAFNSGMKLVGARHCSLLNS